MTLICTDIRFLSPRAGNREASRRDHFPPIGPRSPIAQEEEAKPAARPRRRPRLVSFFALCALAAVYVMAPAAASAANLVPLDIYWNKQRGDNVTCGTEACRRAQVNTGGYRHLRAEGCVLDRKVPGTVPLVLYWSSKRKDNVTVANAQSRREQENAKTYKYVRVEGYVYKNKRSGTIPLWLYWYGKRSDNATVASSRGIRDQRNTKGMQRVRIEGYVYPASKC